MPVLIPAGVSAEVADGMVKVKGPKGNLSISIPLGVKVERTDGKVLVDIDSGVRKTERELASLHGLVRAMIQNMVDGVTRGFEKKLEVQGAGFRPTVTGNKLVMTLGFSHPITIDLPAGVSAKAERVEGGTRGEEKHTIVLAGCDRALVGELAAQIRSLKKADVYKGKGVRYANEVVRRKAGKSAVAAGGTGGK
jgi:large subunit ribosomal protein L6